MSRPPFMARKAPSVAPLFAAAGLTPSKPASRRMGRGQRHKPGVMNKLEQSRADELELLRRSGEVIAFWFEQVTLKLADDTRYTPDFMVLYADGALVFEETKGFWEDDALVKIKVAAAMFPFPFVGLRRLPKKAGGGWERREFKGWTDDCPAPAKTGIEATDEAGDLANKLF